MAILPRSRFRRLHRWVVPICAAPLLLTAATGSLYTLLLEQGIDAFWLVKLHTGRFGPINQQPYYSGILGLLTLIAIPSGIGLLFSGTRRLPIEGRR
ncbi:MAG: hypothetical protein R6U00_09875 [Prochlorococcaceae cyanobacterium]